jgi:acyl-homoserine lactone acylase PvdQ
MVTSGGCAVRNGLVWVASPLYFQLDLPLARMPRRAACACRYEIMTGMGERHSLVGQASIIAIVRDAYGVPHVRAETAADAWLGMGYACAQDRMFQMDYDRRRASGRWAEIAGSAAVSGDILARRLSLVAAAKRDVDAMSKPLREAFESYANGVNQAVLDGPRPFEAEASGYRVEPWQPWHSVAAFKIRHVLMGQWQHKLAQAVLLARIGPDAFGRLETRPPVGSPLAAPPGERLIRLVAEALNDVTRHLGFLAEAEPGSNAWAVSAARTAHGAAVLCNDSHRALDTAVSLFVVTPQETQHDRPNFTGVTLSAPPHRQLNVTGTACRINVHRNIASTKRETTTVLQGLIPKGRGRKLHIGPTASYKISQPAVTDEARH